MEGPERIVCCTLCLCMAVAVFSSVALVSLEDDDDREAADSICSTVVDSSP